MLGVTEYGDKVFTVGDGGDYATFAEAIAYVETLTHWEEETFAVGGFEPSALTWNQGSKNASITLGPIANLVFPAALNSYWIKFDTDTEPYVQIMSANTAGSINFKQERKGANLSIPGDVSFSFLRPIYHRILILNDIENEGNIAVSQPMNLIIEGVDKEILFGGMKGTNDETYIEIPSGTAALYGTYIFKSLHLQGKINTIDTVGISTEQNNTRLIIDDCKITARGSDWGSSQCLGEFYMNNCEVYINHQTGAAHFIQTLTTGDMMFTNNNIYVQLSNNISYSGLITGCGSSVFISSNNNIYLQDHDQQGNGFCFLYGSKGNRYNLIDKTVVYGSSLEGDISYPVHLVKGNQQAGEDNRANTVTHINACYFVGGFADEASLYDIASLGGTAQNATIKISNSKTLTAITPDATYDTLESIDNHFIQSIAYASAITPNINLGQTIDVGVLTGAITINAPTDPVVGQKARFLFEQDGTGNHAITWNAVFKSQTLSAGGVSTKAVYDFEYDGAHWVQTNTAQWL